MLRNNEDEDDDLMDISNSLNPVAGDILDNDAVVTIDQAVSFSSSSSDAELYDEADSNLFLLFFIFELLMAVISIQRHIFVFQPRLLNIRLKRYVIYYFPLLFCLIYPPIFYLIIIVFYPCDGTQWVFSSNLCGYANCYLLYNKMLSSFAWVINNGLPSIIIFLANVVLVFRVIQQKRHRQQLISWKKQRRMALQLLAISSVYMIGWIPNLISGVGQRIISPNFLAQIQLDYLLDLIYIVCLSLPWVCCRLLPEFNKWIWKLFCSGYVIRNDVRPT
ncbi:unnamed protein product [Adineta steineri]|uniref:G-protein coupled receptors family 1 profile domain-containing protein n=1 Tax=Adineta steineri TaxID=433720 RepID=A0A815GDR1_9BILA|nr:unnamed protein product [Adineta steineri]CAF1591706.1 unnamed protein product [Adineta steineri]